MNRYIFTFGLNIFFSLISQAQNQDVIIGKQIWKSEYLSTAIFNNGDSIPYASTQKEWRIAGEKMQPCFTYLKDRNGDIIHPKIFIYNWYVINDKRGFASNGFRVPTNSDIMELISYCGGICETPKKLKSTFEWDKNDLIEENEKTENGTDEFGFTLKPIPMIFPSGQQNVCYLSSGFWTNNESLNGAEFKNFLSEETENEYRGHMAYSFNVTFSDCINYFSLFFKEGGLPVRLIKDNQERNSPNYPIPIFSNSIDNVQLEKNKHIESLCPNCIFVKDENSQTNSNSIIKEIYKTAKTNQEYVFYFDILNYRNISQSAGIGVRLASENGNITVKEIVKGGSCDIIKSIEEDDIIEGIYENGKIFEFKNIELSEAINKIKGVENSKIKLSINSTSAKKKFDVELKRMKLPNWDLSSLINKSNYQSAFPVLIDNYYFFYKYKLIPETHKFEEISPFVYIISKASRLYYAGPKNYSMDDYFNYPKNDWNKDELISGAFQLATLFKGGTEYNPIILKSIDDAKNLLMTFHFALKSTEKLKGNTNISKLNFEHTEDERAITMYFKFE